ncbi:hypothetical protein F8388_008422 [Cannabis sativa]|uniref:Uncharacterized protein n=1 Tax=Cannabis sativa TaxID=3483 RepID=A0A7J6DV85_CANSA|nr:hypothetical protein F8388_008422 [Cannabis sativa]
MYGLSQSYKKVKLLQKLMKKFCEARKEACLDGIDVADETAMKTTYKLFLMMFGILFNGMTCKVLYLAIMKDMGE